MSCKQCRNAISDSDKSMKCDLCEAVFHIQCIGISATNYTVMSKSKNLHWFCDSCNHDQVMNEIKELRNFKSQISKLNEKMDNLAAKVDRNETSDFQQNVGMQREDIVDIIREEREIEKRNASLCLFNFPESQNDEEMIRKLCTDQLGLSGDEIPISEVLRVGSADSNPQRPRILILKLSSQDARRAILRNAPKLRNYVPSNSTLKVYISPDYTRKQREFQKALRSELQTRRANGEQVVIRGDKIIQLARNMNTE